VIDVGGVYFNPGKSGTSKQKAAMGTPMYKLEVIGFDNDHELGEGKNKIRVPAFQYTDVTEYGEDDTPMDKYIQWRSKTWSNNNELYGEYKEQEARA
jgi:hypothetical protein